MIFDNALIQLFAALARVFHSVGAKVILASRNVQQLEGLKFQLDSEPSASKVGIACGT